MRGTRASVAAIAVVVLAGLVGGCLDGGDDDGGAPPVTTAHLLAPTRLTACLDPARAPYTEAADGAPGGVRGLDVDLLTRVATELGVELVVRPTPDVALAEGLAARQCDLAGGGTRRSEVDGEQATRAYTRGGVLLVVREGRAEADTSLDDLVGRRVGVLAGSTAQRVALGSLDGADVTAHGTVASLLDMLRRRDLDAALVDRDALARPLAEHPTLVAVGRVADDEEVVFVVPASTLRSDVDAVLEELDERGELAALERRWAVVPDGDG